MLTRRERRTLNEAKSSAPSYTTTVSEHTRNGYTLYSKGAGARLARWDHLERSMFSLLSHIERHGMKKGDKERFNRFIANMKDMQKELSK